MQGIGVSPGIAIGKALVHEQTAESIPQAQTRSVAEEINRLQASLASVRDQLEKIKEQAALQLGDQVQILDAQILMTRDPELLAGVHEHIRSGMTAEAAWQLGMQFYVQILAGLDSDYMRERVADLRDLEARVQHDLMGIQRLDLARLTEDYIVVAQTLTPSDTVSMDKSHVLGIVTDLGGRTSHSAILARSLEIPAIVGINNVTNCIKTEDLLIVDAYQGKVIVQPDAATLSEYTRRKADRAGDKSSLCKLKAQQTISCDHHRVELGANISTPEDCASALDNGAEGVGLFRSEFLYLNRDSLPDEAEQFQAYKAVLETMAPRPVVIRTLDVGGDKALSYLDLPEESNPFLGYRAIRMCLKQTDIFRTQLRALLRASVFGNLKIMFPMISCIEELHQAKTILNEIRTELLQAGISVGANLEVGIMIEVPAAAIISDILAKEVDFFSIGTNDLIQYTVAVDRMSREIAHLYTPFHPAVLRLIQMVIDNAHRAGIWVGMCGEAAGDPALIPLFLGMGLDEFSMSAPSILPARELIAKTSFKQQTERVAEILQLPSAQAVQERLDATGP